MFARLGRLVTGHPWRVIGVWLVAVVVLVAIAPSLSSVSTSDETSFLPSSSESAQAQKLAESQFPQNAKATSIFVVKRADGGKLTAADRAKVATLATGLTKAHIDRVLAIVTGPTQMAPNGTAQLVTVIFNGSQTDQSLQPAVPLLRTHAFALLAGSGLTAGLTGTVAIMSDTADSFNSAKVIVAVVTVLLIIILLGLIFRSPIAALLPIASIGLVFAVSTAVLGLVAKGFGFKIDQSITALLIVVLFGIGTDYILFLLFRYRERLRAGDTSKAAVATSVHRVGQAIASSGLVVMAAMLALTLSKSGSSRTMAPAFIISVAMMLLAALTLIPALLTLVGPKVFWPSKRWQVAPQGRLWKRLAGLIARRPGRMAAASGGLLVVLAVGLFFMHSSYDFSNALPSNTRSAAATRQLQSSFPAGALAPTQVYVTGRQKLTKAELAAFVARLSRVNGVAAVMPAVVNPSGTTASITLSLKAAPTSTTALDLAAGPLREAAHAAAGPGRQALVGGETMGLADVRSATNRDYKVVFPVAALLILLILAVVLRSLIAPLYLLVGVGLGFAATLGASVFAFQWIKGDPGIVFMLPMMVYLFVVAVGTDYNILLTTRLREEIVEGASPHDAAAMAVEHAGPTVAAAGVILAGTFGSMMAAGIDLLSEMGFAVGIGILLVSIVMAAILIPSVATLLGSRIWWPGHQGERRPARAAAERPAAPARVAEPAFSVQADEEKRLEAPLRAPLGDATPAEEPLL